MRSDVLRHTPSGPVLGALLALGTVLLAAGTASADTVHLKDGSRVVGTIQTLSEQELRIETDFAGELTVEASKIRGLTAERELTVALDSGDRVVGIPEYDPEAEQQRITQTAFGEVAVEDAAIVGLWGPDEPAPEVADAKQAQQQMQKIQQEKQQKIEELEKEKQQQAEEMKAQHQEQLKALREELKPFESPWRFRFQAGLRGRTGNQERISFDARAEARREVPDERLLIFSEGHYAEQSGERSQNEIRGGGKLEVDVSEKWFVFGKGDLEFDEFENLDLRTRLSTGLGYFFWEEEDHELKGRVGLGYQHESFMNGTTFDEGLVEIGYDYRYDWTEWLRFTHGLTFFPTFSDPTGDFRVETETAGEVPLSEDKAWKIRVGMRNEYDAAPQPGVERLDTLYFLNLVYDVE